MADARSKEDEIVGSHALVTGGAQGIGLAIAEAMACRGAAAVTLLDISAKNLLIVSHRWANDRNLRHTLLLTFTADVTNETQVREAVYAAHARCGSLDFVFANAGIGCGGGIQEVDAAFHRKVMEVNFMGVVNTVTAAIPILLKQNAGHMTVTNSLAGLSGVPGLSSYSASKFAVRGFIESARLEMLGTGIKFHIASPGFTDTAMLQTSHSIADPKMRDLYDVTAPALHTPQQVAECMVRGIQQGAYLLPSPDPAVDFLVKGCLVPRAPRPYNLFLDMFLAPLYVFGISRVSTTLNAATERLLLEDNPNRRTGGGRIHVEMDVKPVVRWAFLILSAIFLMVYLGLKIWA